MNRAFVKEPDGGVPEEGLPERQVSDNPNYVTPSGLRQLERKVGETAAKFGIGTIPRPPHWSGFRLVPKRLEFWQDRPFPVFGHNIGCE